MFSAISRRVCMPTPVVSPLVGALVILLQSPDFLLLVGTEVTALYSKTSCSVHENLPFSKIEGFLQS